MLLVPMMLTPLWKCIIVDEANIYVFGSVLLSQAGASTAVDNPGGSVNDPGGGSADDLGSFSNLATSTNRPKSPTAREISFS